MKAKLVCDFSWWACVGQILLVGKDKEVGVAKLVFVEHALKLFTGFGQTVSVVGVDDEDNALGVLEVCCVGAL